MIGKQTRLVVLSTALVFLLSIFTAITTPNTVFADYAPTNGKCNGSDTLTTDAQGQQTCKEAAGSTGATGAPAQQAAGTTCAVEKIGWILCPIIEGSAKLADFAFKFLADNFLAIEPELLTATPDGGSGTITAWQEARNLANIMFVIAFIIIVYSQITGSGLNNYGIKRMLPRLIVAAIAVNISYYLCQAIVDLSNILGYNIMQALQDISKQIGPQVMGIDPGKAINTQTTSDGGILALIAISILPIVGLVWLMLPVLGGIVFFIFITCVTIIIILLLRKAFIVLLVVVSPLAFVMYLLPNTEKYFSKWLDMFWKLLLVFPIVALLMGGGQLASTIILVAGSQDQAVSCDPAANSAAGSGQVQQNGYGVSGECTFPIETPQGQKQSGMMLGLVAAGIAVAPLLAVWSVLQGALSAAGAIGGKIGGAVNSMQGRQKSKLSKSMAENGEYRKNQINAAALRGGRFGAANIVTGGSARRGAKRRAKGNYAKSELHTAETGYVADNAINRETGQITRFGRSLAGGVLGGEEQRNRVRANAVNARNSLEQEEMKAAHAVVDRMDVTGGLTSEAAREAQQHITEGNFDSPHLAALLEHIAKVDQQTFMALASQTSGRPGGSTASRAAAGVMAGMGGFYGGGDVARMQNGTGGAMDLRATARSNIASGSMSSNNLATLSNDGVATLRRLTTGPDATSVAARGHIETAVAGISPDQRGNLSGQKQANLDSIHP